MDGKTHETRLREIEAYLESSRRELDDALESVGIDPEAFRRLTVDADSLRPDLRRAYDEIIERLDTIEAPRTSPARLGIRL